MYEQARGWQKAGVFEEAAHDHREILRLKKEKAARPTAAIVDARTLRSTPESGHRAGYDGHKKTKGSKVYLAVDTLGELLALTITPASVDERQAVEELASKVARETGQSVKLMWADQGYTGEETAKKVAEHGIELVVVRLPEAKKGFVLRRWVVERSFAWASRFKRLSKDYERLASMLANLHVVGYCTLMLSALGPWLQGA